MTGDRPDSRGAWGDEDDDNDSYADNATGLDGLPDYLPIGDDNTEDDWVSCSDDSREAALADNGDETVETLLVTATNPSGSVTATGFMDGRMFEVHLSSQVTRMSESELADEIVGVCNLASRQAEAAQHYLISTLMCELGQDPASTRAFLENTIGLPAPQTVIDERARMYADHYYSNND